MYEKCNCNTQQYKLCILTCELQTFSASWIPLRPFLAIEFVQKIFLVNKSKRLTEQEIEHQSETIVEKLNADVTQHFDV